MKRIQEIERLCTFLQKGRIRIRIIGRYCDFHVLEVTVSDQVFTIYVQDEYDDLSLNIPELNLCLVLRELEIYNSSSDYLVWCTEQGIPPNDDRLRTYYMQLDSVFHKVRSVLGTIDSCITDLDFQLNAGAAQVLRRGNEN